VYWHPIAYSVLMVPLRTYSLTTSSRQSNEFTMVYGKVCADIIIQRHKY